MALNSNRRRKEKVIKKLLLILVAIAFLGGCSGKHASKYDGVIGEGIAEFSEQFNTHMKNMIDLAGTPDGTYKANRKTYNALESKLDVMITRASVASGGKGCKLKKKVYGRVESLFKDGIPSEMKRSTNRHGNPDGCNEKLLALVKEQLSHVKKVHRDAYQCGKKRLSCLRPTTARTTLNLVNQSIDAVSVIEAAKKQ